MPDRIESREQLEGLLAGIVMRGTLFEAWCFNWRLTPARDEEQEGWNIQCSFERPDVDAPSNISQGFGRKWFVAAGTGHVAVVFTAWLAIKQLAEHELMESFVVEVDGEQVRLLDPHKTLADVAHGSRRIS